MVTWIIDKNIFSMAEYPYRIEKMTDCIPKLGHKMLVTQYIPFSDTNELEKQTIEEPFVVYGTIGLMRQLSRHEKFKSGIFHDDFDFSERTNISYSEFEFVNQRCAFIQYRYLKSYISTLNFSMFVKPNGGSKLFAGTVIKPGEYDYFLKKRLRVMVAD